MQLKARGAPGGGFIRAVPVNGGPEKEKNKRHREKEYLLRANGIVPGREKLPDNNSETGELLN
jgi:hypothetical protein